MGQCAYPTFIERKKEKNNIPYEKGVLYVASLAGDSGGQVLALSPNGGNSSIVVSSGLSSPYGVAVDAQGKIYVSDLGASQQVKVFSPKGSILKVMGL